GCRRRAVPVTEDRRARDGTVPASALDTPPERIEPPCAREPPRQLAQSRKLLGEHHARGVALSVHLALPVLVGLQLHVLEESLAHRVQVLERLEGRADRRPSTPPRP